MNKDTWVAIITQNRHGTESGSGGCLTPAEKGCTKLGFENDQNK